VGDGRRDGGFDTSFVAIGGVMSGALALGAALLFKSLLSTDGGPTAAALSEGLSLLYGAAVGLAVGAALIAFGARAGPPVLTGSIAGMIGYSFVLVPVLIMTGPDDVSYGESFSTAVFVAVLVAPAIALGAVVGARVRGYQPRSGTSRRSRARSAGR
jgi:hypothetical protein